MTDMSRQDKRKCFTFIWTLENVSYNWQERYESIRSPTFAINDQQKSKYYLDLYPRGQDDDNYIDFYLQGEVYNHLVNSPLEIDCELALLSKDGSVLTSLKREQCEFSADFRRFKEIKDIFDHNRSTYLPEDKLRVRCRIWKSDREMTENVQCSARTRIHIQMQSLLWNIRNFSSIQSEEKCTYQMNSVPDDEVLMTLDLFFKNPYMDEDSINIQLVAKNGKIKYFVLHLMPLNGFSSGNKCIRKEFLFCEKEKQKLLILPFSKNDLIANKNLCLPDDVLSFRFECTFSTGKIFEEIEKVVYSCENFPTSEADDHCLDEENTLSASKRILNEDIKSLFRDDILSDIKLKTSSKTYLSHKSILSARSPVFKAMFSNNMKEKFNECVDIDDLDSAAVCRMLHYVYTAEIQDLEWENACDLYRAADKYEILALRDDCSACLKSKLCSTNACEVLIFADTHQDNDLKTSVQDFIFDHDIIISDEWEHLMKSHLKLAADTMRLQIQRKQLSNKLYTSARGFDCNSAATPCASHALYLPQCPSFQFGRTPPYVPAPTTITAFQFVNSPVTEAFSSSAPRKIRKCVRRKPRKDCIH